MNDFLKLFMEEGESDEDSGKSVTPESSTDDIEEDDTSQSDDTSTDTSEEDFTTDDESISQEDDDLSGEEQDSFSNQQGEDDTPPDDLNLDTQIEIIKTYNDILALKRTMETIIESLTSLSGQTVGMRYILRAIDLSKQLVQTMTKYLARYNNDGDSQTIKKNYNSMYKAAMDIMTALKSSLGKAEDDN